jgi:hypothetical protein
VARVRPAQALEAFLARLYTDGALRAAFLGDPVATAAAAGVAPEDAAGLAAIDRADLALAAASISRKRAR